MAMTPLSGSSFLSAYLEQNKKLVKTMVIKSSISADVLNDYIKLKHGESSVDKYNPRSWKYYLNIAGEYHPLDTLMTVTSLDTLQEIAFTKENLLVHTTTAEAYGYGSRYYYSLLNRFPNQEQLILGVMYPVDLDQAVEAENGTILGFPKGLVEPQEQTLIRDLEDFIKRHYIRWNVQAFGVSDSLYNASYYAQMYLTLLPKLLNLRLRRCRTSEVHSFHIREFLASNGRLDRYLPFLTLKQALFLCRNLNYIERNTGKSHILETLIQKILTDRRIPIAEYSVRHLNEFDEEFYPLVTARRKPINDQYNIAEKNYVDLEDLYEKERKLTYGTGKFYEGKKLTVDRQFQTSISSVTQTKNLESNMVDYNDAVPDTLEEVLMRQWAHMATEGLYDVVINFKDPQTSEYRSLYAIDALIYMNYIGLMSIGIETSTIPVYLNLKYRRHPKPALEELLSVVDSKLEGIAETAYDIWSKQPTITRCFSSSMFFDLSYLVYEESKRHWYLISNTHELNRRAAVNAMVLKLYADKLVVLDPSNQNINEWLNQNNLPVYNYSYNQAQELVRNIFTAATGLTVDETRQLKNIQKAMLSLLGDLSSYSIQMIREINDSEIRPLNWAAIRAGNFKYSSDGQRYVEVNARVTDKDAVTADHGVVNSKIVNIQSIDLIQAKQHVEYRSKVSTVYGFRDERDVTVNFRSFTSYATYAGHDPLISAQAGYIGKEFYLALTDEQKNQLISIYD